MTQKTGLLLLLCVALTLTNLRSQPSKITKMAVPVNPNASPEARKLLNYLYSINGKSTLTGVHNYLGKMSVATDSVYKITGKYPAIWGSDFGFSDSTHDIDNIKYRPKLIEEIKKQYNRGSIIVITYHQANPLISEPCQFESGVQSKLTDEQWKNLTTPGSEIYNAWKKQMDIIAGYLKQLQDAKIPILFRPYHENNGTWFWWGGRPGESGFIALWKQLFEYYTKECKLNNLIWVWSSDKPWPGVESFYPGDKFVDIVGSDIYPVKDTSVVFRQEWWVTMKKMAGNKPLALTENSAITSPEILKKQPWLWFMTWDDLLFSSNTTEEIRQLYNSEHVITRDELPDWKK